MANTEQKKTNKSRMLFILRYLMQNTNEDHMVSLSDLTNICDANGFGRPNRRTIISDIRELTESEYPIEVEVIGQTHYFYYSGHLTPSELRVLVDAVEAAQFITKKDSLVLMEKLIKLSNEYSCAVTPQIRQTGNRLSGNAGTAYASLLA